MRLIILNRRVYGRFKYAVSRFCDDIGVVPTGLMRLMEVNCNKAFAARAKIALRALDE